MSLFKSNNSTSSADPFITVNCNVEAKISNRVNFHTQNFEYQKDDNSNLIGFIARSYETGFKDSKKGMLISFPSDIQSGVYSPKDSNFPFDSFKYYEAGSNGKFTTFYDYVPESGTIKVEVVANDNESLRYHISFDFKGKDHRTEELQIVGKLEINVFTRNL